MDKKFMVPEYVLHLHFSFILGKDIIYDTGFYTAQAKTAKTIDETGLCVVSGKRPKELCIDQPVIEAFNGAPVI